MVEEKDKWWGDERETAELIWCAAHLHRMIAPLSPKGVKRSQDLHPSDGESPAGKPLEHGAKTTSPPAAEETPRTPIAISPKNTELPPASPKTRESPSSDRASPIRVPDPFPLPKPAAISKALLPLAKRVPGMLANELDINATVEQPRQMGCRLWHFALP